MWFDESRLDDEAALNRADLRLRALAESGARVRLAATDAAAQIAVAVAESTESRPRAVIAAGPDSRLLRAVLEPWCPVPFVAWPGAALPGWTGSLDLVVILAPERSDPAAASAVAEAVRRGCQVVVACQADSMVARHAVGRWATVLPISSGDQLATAVVLLDYLHQIGLGPAADADEVAEALDAVAISASPHRDLAVNPAKVLAIALADTSPLVWGGSVLAARAARRVAESIRRASGRGALAGDAEHLLPVLEATRARTVFEDPFADDGGDLRSVLLILDDGADDPVASEQRGQLVSIAENRGVRVETLSCESGSEVARYASLILSGNYAAAYLQLGLIED